MNDLIRCAANVTKYRIIKMNNEALIIIVNT